MSKGSASGGVKKSNLMTTAGVFHGWNEYIASALPGSSKRLN